MFLLIFLVSFSMADLEKRKVKSETGILINIVIWGCTMEVTNNGS